VDGFAYVTSQFEVRVRNTFDRTPPLDCRVESLLASAPGFPGCARSETCNLPGYGQASINANLPTQRDGGSYLGVHQSVARVLPVVRGVNTLYLNGRTGCAHAVWGAMTVTAQLVESGPATLTMP